MGLVHKIVSRKVKELDQVTCDRCQKEIQKESKGHWNKFGESYTHYHEAWFRDFALIRTNWGYFSGKDGETHEIVLCEPCYDKVFKSVKIQILSSN